MDQSTANPASFELVEKIKALNIQLTEAEFKEMFQPLCKPLMTPGEYFGARTLARHLGIIK